MTKDEAMNYVSVILDDAGGEVKESKVAFPFPFLRVSPKARFVVWQCGFNPLIIAVQSYLDVRLDDDEAEDIAVKWLEERGWFGKDDPREADWVI